MTKSGRMKNLRANLPKIGMDAILFALAYSVAFQLRQDIFRSEALPIYLVFLPVVVAIKSVVFLIMGNYRSIWRYSSLTDLENLTRATLVALALILAIAAVLPPHFGLPRALPFLDAVLSLLLAGALRMAVRIQHESSIRGPGGRDLSRRLIGARKRGKARPTLIVGAGHAGEFIVREMLRSPMLDYSPVGFVDDNPVKQGQSIHGVPVLGTREQIPQLVRDLGVKEVVIAIPSARGKEVREIIQCCRDIAAGLKILPDLNRVVDGTVRLEQVRRVEVEDLLGREPVEMDMSLISGYLRGKRVLITGAGGSIGSELCRQILRFAPSEIQLFGRGENSIYEIHRELKSEAGCTRLIQLIGDVINKKKLEGVFSIYRPQIVFHAGADKHVPLMEMNPDEAVFNNVIGTQNVIQVSDEMGVERVVCISTDKAVNPTSVMGCCKRVAELLVQGRTNRKTIACAVRFGNVLGSRGSVIPHFQSQIEKGQPLTVTHRDIERYFMTIPEAATLVIQAGAMGLGGEIFVLDMGEPVKIWDLANNMVRLAGLEPGKDVEIREIGLRSGEKMNEELQTDAEMLEPTAHPKINCVRNSSIGEANLVLLAEIENLRERAVRMDFAGIRSGLKRIVPEYQWAPKAPSRPSRLRVVSDQGSIG